MTFRTVFDGLLDTYGPQHWWPAETPFEVMVGAVLTQNTAWSNVEKAIANLKAHAVLAPEAIRDCKPTQLADWLRPSGYFNIKAKRLQNYCRWYLQQAGFAALNRLPTDVLRKAVLSVNGVGYETADDILLYAFERPVFVIDAYTRRIFSRLGLVEEDWGYEHLRHHFEQQLDAEADKVALFGEYHALIVRHAKEACRKRSLCSVCCLKECCPSAVADEKG